MSTPDLDTMVSKPSDQIEKEEEKEEEKEKEKEKEEQSAGSTPRITDLTLPGVKDSPVQHYRISHSGTLLVDQGTQTTSLHTDSITRRVSRPVSVTPTNTRSNTQATAAIAKWAQK